MMTPVRASQPTKAPRELGSVKWTRSFDNAVSTAKSSNKLLLILFDEVPGCSTCKGYGDTVLTHPLIVEAAETLFTPVAIYNNVPGDDAKVLKSFNEPAWNNPVVRLVSPDRKAVNIRVSDDYSIAGLASAMAKAMVANGEKAPTWLQLLVDEQTSRLSGLESATFAMHCFWEGESKLGGLAGVMQTMPGFVDGHEVVQLQFDPRKITYEQLIGKAGAMQCCQMVYTHSDTQQRIAEGKFRNTSKQLNEDIKADNEPKYYISRTPMRFVPMTSLQACRINSALGISADPSQFLSPRQRELLVKVLAHPDKKWPNAIGTDNLTRAWTAAMAVE